MKFKHITFAAASSMALVSILGCGKSPTKEQIATSGEECRNFIATEMKSGGAFPRPLETEITDSWLKDGKLVFEVAYREQYLDKSYSVRKCIVDEEKGTLTSPSPMNDSKWDK